MVDTNGTNLTVVFLSKVKTKTGAQKIFSPGFPTINCIKEMKIPMIRIEPEQWLPACFSRTAKLADILRFPSEEYPMLDADSQDELRQSQIEPNEIVRVLGFHERHVLIMKLDKVLGWVAQTDIAISPEIKSFEPVKSLMLQPDEFFDLWEGTPYLWGGITRYGIDCSGLTQRYFKDVLNCIIPKNSNDQRRIGLRKELADVAEHDLVFCTRIGGRGIHHVAIYSNGGIWHADGKLGVMNQSLNDFVSNWKILDVVSLNREKLTCSAALL